MSKTVMEEPETYYDSFKHLFLPKRFKGDRHRSVVKEDYCVFRRVAKYMSKEEFAEAAGTFQHQKYTHLKTFLKMKSSSTEMACIGTIWISFQLMEFGFAVCSCETGMKEAFCNPAITIYFNEGKMIPLSQQPKVKRFSRNQGS